MIDTFKQTVSIEKYFQDGHNLVVKNDSYLISYPEFLKYFKDLDKITKHNLIIGIHFTYGWMPTIFDFREKNFDECIELLNKAKNGNILTVEELALLKALLNNSLVGTSKLLHFINPDKYAIWDSRVYRYLTNKPPYEHNIGKCETYLAYLEFCNYLIQQPQFISLKENIEKKTEYTLSNLRIVELVMFSNGKKQPSDEIKE